MEKQSVIILQRSDLLWNKQLTKIEDIRPTDFKGSISRMYEATIVLVIDTDGHPYILKNRYGKDSIKL